MPWLVPIAQLIAAFHAWSATASAWLAEKCPALELTIFFWFALTLVLGVRAQRDLLRKKPAAAPSAAERFDRIALPSGEELWREFDKYGVPTGNWLKPPPPKPEPAPTATAKAEQVEEKLEKKPITFWRGGKEV